MNADSTGSGAFIKVDGNRLRDLLLQVAEVLPLRGDATQPLGSSHHATSQPDSSSR